MKTTTADVAAHYDSLDALYLQLWGEHLHHGLWINPHLTKQKAVEALIEKVVDRLGLSAGDRICDIGCGYGASLRHLAKTRSVRGVGLSVSIKQIEYAHRQPHFPNIEYLCQDFLKNDLPSESFDAAYSIESSEHMPDFESFLLEIKRLLKPGKRFSIAAWLRNPHTVKILGRHLNDKIVEEGRLVQMYPTDEFLNRVAKHFRIVQFDDVSPFVSKTWWISARNLVYSLIRDEETRKFLKSQSNKDRIFAVTVARILLAYKLGAMRYGILVAEKS